MRKKEIQQNVLKSALQRIEYLYKMFDTPVVAFSGGKDSTAVLNCAIMVAKKLNRLPVKVAFFDEEAITFETIEFVERTMRREEVEMLWYCVNVKHRNACSNIEPFWWSWDPNKKDIWVRPMPEWAISEIPGFNPFTDTPYTGVSDAMECLFQDRRLGKVVVMTGIRTQESLRRYRIVTSRENENFITSPRGGKFKNLTKAHPIYDWSAEDVWVGVDQFGWDYNKTYDIFNLTGLHGKLAAQRVCAPFGEEPLRGLWIYRECFPQFWAKLCMRVKGVGSAVRYSNTELYSVGLKRPPSGMTWQQYTEMIIENYRGKEAAIIRDNLQSLIDMHYKKSILDINEDVNDPISGICWKFLCQIAIKGDFKRRLAGNANSKSEKTQKKMGITFGQAILRYATPKFKKEQIAKFPHLFDGLL